MRTIFEDNGQLSEEGKRIFLDFNYGLGQILNSDQVLDMTETQLQTLGIHLLKMIGDTITNRIARKRQFDAKLQAMTDQQFEVYLKDKYSEHWNIHSLEEEELRRAMIMETFVDGVKS
jgi:hypothetical protein